MFARPATVVSVLSLLLLLFVVAPASAKVSYGPCEWRGEDCIRPMGITLEPEQAARFRDASTLPSEPLQKVRYDLRTGETTFRDFDVSEAVQPPEMDVVQLEPKDSKAGRSPVLEEKPWNDTMFRTVVKLVMTFPNNVMAGCSGTVIGQHTIFTAGHCVFSHDSESYGWASSIEVYPASSSAGYSTPFGGTEVKADGVHTTSWWVQSEDFRGDYAVLTVNHNIGALTGWHSPMYGGSSSNYYGTIRAAGYPGAEGFTGYYLVHDSASVNEVNDYTICFADILISGMSGGPSYYYSSGAYRIAAANSYSVNGWYDYSCSCRYSSGADSMRVDSEAEATQDQTEYWTCDLNKFWDEQYCDCECGMWDRDCNDYQLPVRNCGDGGRCLSPGVCQCTPDCQGKNCGPNGCGGSCGTCPTGIDCVNGVCDCTPDCDGKECGDDGCGGSCGSCLNGIPCSNGICQCTPHCDGRECGPDGCGGYCGQCDDGVACIAGQCECTPSCLGRDCGDDGCGGSCGLCSVSEECENGHCVCNPDCTNRNCGSDGCGGSCGSCENGEECVGGICGCEPDCTGKICGDNGCNGSCGDCPADTPVCSQGTVCVECTQDSDCANQAQCVENVCVGGVTDGDGNPTDGDTVTDGDSLTDGDTVVTDGDSNPYIPPDINWTDGDEDDSTGTPQVDGDDGGGSSSGCHQTGTSALPWVILLLSLPWIRRRLQA